MTLIIQGTTLEVIESIELSLDLIGVSAFAHRGDDFNGRCQVLQSRKSA
jgi:hypothetical protein